MGPHTTEQDPQKASRIAANLDRLDDLLAGQSDDQAERLRDTMDAKDAKVYTVEEVAGILKLSTTAVRAMIKRGDIKGIRIGTSLKPPIRVTAEELQRILSGKGE